MPLQPASSQTSQSPRPTSRDRLSFFHNSMRSAWNCSSRRVRASPVRPRSQIPTILSADRSFQRCRQPPPLSLIVVVVRAQGPSEFSLAFAAMAKSRVDSVVVTEDGEFAASFRAIATLALANKLPSIGAAEYAEAGGLIGYGVNILDLYRRAAYFVDRILKGAKPADLPIEQATKFELIVNLKTAKTLG